MQRWCWQHAADHHDNIALGNPLAPYIEAAKLHAPTPRSDTIFGANLACSRRVQLDVGSNHRGSGTPPEWQPSRHGHIEYHPPVVHALIRRHRLPLT